MLFVSAAAAATFISIFQRCANHVHVFVAFFFFIVLSRVA